jgi:predicted permease
MSWRSVFAARFRGLFIKGNLERELDDEIRFHLDMQAEDNRRAGMDLAEARYAAMRSFGLVEPVKESYRERRTFALVETAVRDMLHGARSLGRLPGFTIAAGLSLALGIGVTTAIFTVLNAVALRPLPYADADRLFWMTQILKKSSTDEVTLTGYFLEWRRQNQTFTDLAGYNYQTSILTGRDEATELRTAKVSASLLPLLGVQPVLGRNFLKREDYKGFDHVAILGNALWQQRFGANPKIVGQAITLDGSPFTIVGVLPPGFMFPGSDHVQLITPLGKDEAAELRHEVGSVIFNVIGRLKPGVTLEQAKADLAVIQSRLPVPAFHPTITLKILPLRAHLLGDVKAAGIILVAAAGFVLLIACANVSNLLLTRWMQRGRELAIRAALGGSRARLVCQLLTENALLGVLACFAGIALAFCARRPMIALSPYHLSGLQGLPFDAHVLGFAVALGLLTTLLFGLLPAFRVTKVELAEAIKAGEAPVVSGRGSLGVLSAIAAAEIAIILVLSTGAGLMLQSFWKMRYVSLGFRPDHLVVATLNLSGSAYREEAPRSAFIQELLERTQSLPGVELAAVTNAAEIPPGDFHATNTFAIERRNQPLGGVRPIARYPAVSAAYFAILGIPLLQGRLFQDSDGVKAPPVVVVNRALVHRYFDRENPIGKRVRTGGDDQPWRTIAGVVEDVKTSGLTSAPEPTIYLPYRQTDALAEVGLVMRSPLEAGIVAAELRKSIASLDASQPVSSVQAMGERLSESVSGPRFTTVLLFAFAGLAIVLGLIGVYGVMGCRVRWQLRELAVRQALGAQQQDVIWHVLRQGFAIILPGLAAGLLGTIALSRLLSSVLYGISAYDPPTFVMVATGMAGVALLACWVPAMRAARSDPLQLLRHD